MRLLIVEDDRGLAGGIAFFMERDGCEIICAGTLAHAREIFETEKPDAVLLDLNLPDGDGLEFCREIRRSSRTPILMLTARDMETDEVQGLLSGADDYLTKPFSLAVLKARLDAVLRRTGRKLSELAMVGDRLYTDIETGIRSGMTSILVMSGETTEAMLAESKTRPDFKFGSLKDMIELL